MNNFVLSVKFENFILKVSQLKCEDGLHFTFKVDIESNNFLTSCIFEEVTYYQLPYDKKENRLEIFDECGQRCKLKLDKEELEFILKDDNNENITSTTRIRINTFEDQDKLNDFFIEFNALCLSQF